MSADKSRGFVIDDIQPLCSIITTSLRENGLLSKEVTAKDLLFLSKSNDPAK
jgi:hypothetical protein